MNFAGEQFKRASEADKRATVKCIPSDCRRRGCLEKNWRNNAIGKGKCQVYLRLQGEAKFEGMGKKRDQSIHCGRSILTRPAKIEVKIKVKIRVRIKVKVQVRVDVEVKIKHKI